jgi:hypothetical protein
MEQVFVRDRLALMLEHFGTDAGCVSRVVEILLSRPPSGLICA